ncbi:hypothetical protein HYS93_00690 [Candidatus Daviesbacteria bacterium]|nr:hypothetical protein [Candidatus Daviesbacteria bacterium]
MSLSEYEFVAYPCPGNEKARNLAGHVYTLFSTEADDLIRVVSAKEIDKAAIGLKAYRSDLPSICLNCNARLNGQTNQEFMASIRRSGVRFMEVRFQAHQVFLEQQDA